MTEEDRDIQRKLKVLRHAEKTGDVARTCPPANGARLRRPLRCCAMLD